MFLNRVTADSSRLHDVTPVYESYYGEGLLVIFMRQHELINIHEPLKRCVTSSATQPSL